MARKHQARHALFARPCARCDKAFDYCGSCEPGRRYCGDVCAAFARSASVREAHSKYNDRESEEGLENHRVEEADRRARRAADSVGDHRCQEKSVELQVPRMTEARSVTETIDATLANSVALPVAEAPALGNGEAGSNRIKWVLVAWPELFAAARRRQGTEAGCPFCGRRGEITEVISIDQWRQRPRRGWGQGE